MTEVNQAVIEAPELVNDDPYGQGWLIKVRLSDPAELDGLLDARPTPTQPDGPVAMPRLSELERAIPFSRRHIGPSPEDQERMLALLGHASLDDLARAAVPASILLERRRSTCPRRSPRSTCSPSCASSGTATA